jgi:hypothetical protein
VENDSVGDTNTRHNSLTQTLAYYSTLLFTTATLMLAPLNPNDSMAWAATTSVDPATEQSTLLQTSPLVKQKESVVEEAWNLINKYFIDRTFNDQVCGT